MQSVRYGQLLFVAFSGLVLMSGCQKPAPANDKDKVIETAKTTPSSSQPTTTATKVADAVLPPAPAVSDQKVDLSQAHDINQDSDLSYLTPLFLAKTTRQMSEEEKLGLLSAEYANEKDAFKKRELATKLKPELVATLDKYKGTYLIKMPILDQNGSKQKFEASQQQKKLSSVSNYGFGSLQDSDKNASNGFYNFDTHSFKTFCSIRFDAHNKQNIQFDFGYDKEDGHDPVYNPPPKEGCDLSITDEAIAKKIETQIAKKTQYDPNILRTGEIYYTVTADDNFLRASPVYAKITYTMPDTGETLISKAFHW